MSLYVLVGHVPVKTNIIGWSKWFEFYWDSEERVVAFTKTDTVEISTVFLGIDTNWRLDGNENPPILFETMAFHKLETPKTLINGMEVEWNGEERIKSTTWEEAEQVHQEMVRCLISQNYQKETEDGPTTIGGDASL
jgi:hypothetical protein